MTPALRSREHRLVVANDFIRIVSEHGRRFFHHEGQVARLELGPRGHVWFVSEWSGRRTFTHYPHRWRHFGHGGTMRALIEALRDYVLGRRELPSNHLGPWRKELCDGDLWGYGADAMAEVRRRAAELKARAS